LLVLTLAGVAAGVGLCLAGAVAPGFDHLHADSVPVPLGAAFGLFIAAAAVFALAVAAVALAGAFLAVLFARLLTGLILLAAAAPFLLPLIIPLALVLVVGFATRRSNGSRAA
jgi:hypothetical protein